jgi:hypothetical protein
MDLSNPWFKLVWVIQDSAINLPIGFMRYLFFPELREIAGSLEWHTKIALVLSRLV